LVMAGIGFDAEVVEHLDLALKRATGKLAYVASILGRLRDYRPCFYRAEVDGAAVSAASLVAAKAHFYGGRFVLAPAARLEEPLLQVVVFAHAGRGAALGYLTAMSLGLLQRCRSLSILPGRPVRPSSSMATCSFACRLGSALHPLPCCWSPLSRKGEAQAPATVMPSMRIVGASTPVLNS